MSTRVTQHDTPTAEVTPATIFTTIMLALDDLDRAQPSISLATALARREHASLVLAHVEQTLAVKGGPDLHPDEAEIQSRIRALTRQLSEEGVDTRLETAGVMGTGPAQTLAEIAERTDADLIVLGSRTHRAILAGLPERLLHDAHRPVLVVPDGPPGPT
jgi:nucleotide-binding universal stress UspA family protein